MLTNDIRSRFDEKRKLTTKYKDHLGKLYLYNDELIATFEVTWKSMSDSDFIMKSIVIRGASESHGGFRYIPLDELDSLEEFPSVLLWGFRQ